MMYSYFVKLTGERPQLEMTYFIPMYGVVRVERFEWRKLTEEEKRHLSEEEMKDVSNNQAYGVILSIRRSRIDKLKFPPCPENPVCCP